MGKAKRRKQARSFNETSTPKNLKDRLIAQTNDPVFHLACDKSPELCTLWLCMVEFIQRTNYLTTTETEAINFWHGYWGMATYALGRAHIGDPKYHSEHCFWLSRIKRAIKLGVQSLHYSLSEISMSVVYSEIYEKNEARKQLVEMGETTIEIGLAFQQKLIIYQGKSLIVYKGTDDPNKKGELMIATKNLNGCWTHYPQKDNESVPLSDYKKAKLALERFPTSLKGELIHKQSSKLAKLLGLMVSENYAYLLV